MRLAPKTRIQTKALGNAPGQVGNANCSAKGAIHFRVSGIGFQPIWIGRDANTTTYSLPARLTGAFSACLGGDLNS
jgi:hypothetical protein